MALRLTIENVPSLPDGGPISYAVSGKRGFDIGRDQYLDWVLPDPNRVISGKHCEVRYRDGAYWLRDVSTNGTFVNRNERRLQEQHRLRAGDRIEIGHYIINVEVEGEDEAADNGEVAEPGEPGLWGSGAGAAPPVDPRSLKPANIARPVQSADVLDWIAAVPEPLSAPAPQAYSPPPAPYQPSPAQPPASYAPPPAPAYAPPAEDVWGGGGSSATPASWDAPPIQPPAPKPAAPPPPPPLASPPPEPERSAAVEAEPVLVMPRATPPVFEPPPVVGPPPPQPVAPPPVREQRPAPSSAAPSSASGAEFIRRFAKGAGLSEDAIAARDAGQLAEMLGVLMNIVAGNVGQLLVARAESKGAMRSSNQTLIQAADNNPLRFSPTAEDALAVMFGRPTKSYLDAQRAFEQSFLSLKAHQVDSFAAIQAAIQQLVVDLDPKEIEKAIDAAKSSSVFANKKARLWDEFVLRWRTKTGAHETGLLGAFMQYFGDAYDRRRR